MGELLLTFILVVGIAAVYFILKIIIPKKCLECGSKLLLKKSECDGFKLYYDEYTCFQCGYKWFD